MIAVKSGLKRVLVLLFIISNINVFSQEKYEIIINDGQVVESEFDVAIIPLDTNNIVLLTLSNQGNKSDLSIWLLLVYLTRQLSPFHHSQGA